MYNIQTFIRTQSLMYVIFKKVKICLLLSMKMKLEIRDSVAWCHTIVTKTEKCVQAHRRGIADLGADRSKAGSLSRS